MTAMAIFVGIRNVKFVIRYTENVSSVHSEKAAKCSHAAARIKMPNKIKCLQCVQKQSSETPIR